MFETLLRTVFGDRYSSAAIWAFERPAATSVEDLVLAGGELRERARRRGGRRRGEELGHPPGDRRPEDRLALGDRGDRADDLGLVRALQQVPARTGAHRGEQRLILLGHRQHDDADVRTVRGDRAGSPRCRPARGICTSITTTSGCSSARAVHGLDARRPPYRRPRRRPAIPATRPARRGRPGWSSASSDPHGLTHEHPPVRRPAATWPGRRCRRRPGT